MHPKTIKRTNTWVLEPMGWIGCVRCNKFWHDFMARNFALIALVQPILHRVSCSNEMIPNPPRHYETHQNMSLGSNGVDWVRSLRDILMWLHGTNFCINCTSSPRFAPSFMQLRNNPKCTQTLLNTPKHDFRVQWGDQVCSLQKITTWLHGTNFCFIWTSSVCFATSFMHLRNDPKCTQTLWNAPKHEFRVQWGVLGAFVAKNPDVTSWHELLH